MPSGDEWSRLRREIGAIDEQILELVARRLTLAAEIGEAKRAHGLPVKNYAVERTVLERARTNAAALGLPESVAVGLTRLLIDSSCRVQEERLERHATADRPASGRLHITIVGGHGRMGRWLGRYFETFGHQVTATDVVGPDGAPMNPAIDTLAQAAASDAIVFATPISVTPSLLARLTDIGTAALVFDICSLKTPLLSAIQRAEDAGLRVTSVHPMFGPAVDSLVGRNIVVCQGRDLQAAEAATGLFSGSAAALLRIPLPRHDEFMSVVLGLSHLTSLVFNEAVVRSGLPHPNLRAVASTTFDAQCAVSEKVARENPDLYYEIQVENAFTPAILSALSTSLTDFVDAINRKDPAAFRSLMERGRQYFDAPDAS